MARSCKGCPDRFVGPDENGHWTTCHATCPDYAKIVERSRRISEARRKDHNERNFVGDTKNKILKIKKHNGKK